MRRIGMVASVLTAVSLCTWTGVAGSQETTTTTTVDPVETTTTTTTADPVETTVAPETTTTLVEETTTTTSTTVPEEPLTLAPVELVGQHVDSGSLSVDARFNRDPGSDCSRTADLAGAQTNVLLDSAGSIGGVYGLANAGAGKVGVFVVGMGAIPVGVAVVSASDGDCEFDAIGVGTYASTGTQASFDGVGIGVYPGGYDNPDFMNRFSVTASVGSTSNPAQLDAAATTQFVLRPRPGLNLGG